LNETASAPAATASPHLLMIVIVSPQYFIVFAARRPERIVVEGSGGRIDII
jgi:hypothetical protein